MPVGPPSNRKETGTCRISEICLIRLAPTRLVPFSYFWTCWKVRPKASPSFSWLMPSIMRRIRTRLPTYLSTGFGALVICNSPCDQAPADEADEIDSAPGANTSNLARRSEEIADNLSNELTGSYSRAHNAKYNVDLSTEGYMLSNIFGDR